MMNIICIFIACAFGQFAAYTYFSSRFESSRPKTVTLGFFAAATAVQFAASFAGIAAINIALLLICNICAALIIFKTNAKQTLLHCALLEILAIASALFISVALPKIISVPPSGDTTALLGISASMLYFTLAYSASNHAKFMAAYAVLISLLSLSCTAMIAGFAFFPGSSLLFELISVALPILTTGVCFTHKKIVCSIAGSTESRLEEQRQKLNEEYYAELEHQYDLRDILIHDMKGQLRTIKQLSQNGENDRINDYIDSIYNSGMMGAVKQFSSNKLANVIISRYANLCANSEIKFNCDVRSIDFSFLSDGDLTVLLDNILHGAYKESAKSMERFIDIGISSFNEAYVVLNIKNSVEIAPDIKNSERAERIAKIVKKYGGQASFDCSDGQTFTAKIMFKSSAANIK